jgi:hypothetical protein
VASAEAEKPKYPVFEIPSLPPACKNTPVEEDVMLAKFDPLEDALMDAHVSNPSFLNLA